MENNFAAVVRGSMLALSALALFGGALWLRWRQISALKRFNLPAPPLWGGEGGSVPLPAKKEGLPATRFKADISSIGSGRREFHLRWEMPFPSPLEFRLNLQSGYWQSAFDDILGPLRADPQLKLITVRAGAQGLRYLQLSDGVLKVISWPLPALSGAGEPGEAGPLAQELLEYLFPVLSGLPVPAGSTRLRLGRHKKIKFLANAFGIGALLSIALAAFLQERFAAPGPVLVFWKPALGLAAVFWAAALLVYSRFKTCAGSQTGNLRLALTLMAPALFSIFLFILPQINTRLDNSPLLSADAVVFKTIRTFYSMKDGARQAHGLTLYLKPQGSRPLPYGINSFKRWESEFSYEPPASLNIHVKRGALGVPWIFSWEKNVPRRMKTAGSAPGRAE